MLRRAQDSGNRNRLLIFSMVIASYGSSDRDFEEIGTHLKSARLCLPDERCTYRSGRVRIVHDVRTTCANALADYSRLALGGL